MAVPKLVVFDVDGTLIDGDGRVSARTHRVLRILRDRRIPIVLATGRPMAIARHTLGQIGGAEWMVCGNGSVLFDTNSGELLRDNCLPDDIVEPVVHGLRSSLHGVGFAIELATTVIEEVGFAHRVPEEPMSPPVDDALQVLLADRQPVRRIIPYHDDYDDRLDELAAIVERFIDDRCQVHFGGLPIVDVSPKGNHKAAALEVLVERLGMSRHDVLAFGDGRNDIEMLRWAGTGIAMGNAHVDVQDASDLVTESVTDDGVAHILESVLAR